MQVSKFQTSLKMKFKRSALPTNIDRFWYKGIFWFIFVALLYSFWESREPRHAQTFLPRWHRTATLFVTVTTGSGGH